MSTVPTINMYIKMPGNSDLDFEDYLSLGQIIFKTHVCWQSLWHAYFMKKHQISTYIFPSCVSLFFPYLKYLKIHTIYNRMKHHIKPYLKYLRQHKKQSFICCVLSQIIILQFRSYRMEFAAEHLTVIMSISEPSGSLLFYLLTKTTGFSYTTPVQIEVWQDSICPNYFVK